MVDSGARRDGSGGSCDGGGGGGGEGEVEGVDVCRKSRRVGSRSRRGSVDGVEGVGGLEPQSQPIFFKLFET